MTKKMNQSLTRLVLAALETARLKDRDWWLLLRISPTKLAKLRAGETCLSDADLHRISQKLEQPWPLFVLEQLGDSSALTSDTCQILTSLCSPAGSAPKPRRASASMR